MPLYTVDGLSSRPSGALTLLSQAGVVCELGSNDGSHLFVVRDDLGQSCVEISSDRTSRFYSNVQVDQDMTINGTLYVAGDKVSIVSQEVNIGDSVLNLNAGIEDTAQNQPSGISAKVATVASGSVLDASNIDSGTDTITITAGPGPLVVGDIFYIKGSQKNDGYYKVLTVNATDLVIDTTATNPGIKTSLIDETGATYKITKGSPSLIYFDSGWKRGFISDDGNNNFIDILGDAGILAEDYDISNKPNIGATGTSSLTSAAKRVGLFAGGLSEYVSAPNNLQDFADQTNALFAGITSSPTSNAKSGSQAMGNGVTSIAVVYGAAFTTSTNQIWFSFENTTDAGPTQITGIVTAKSNTGFTVELSSALPTGNYVMNWLANGT